MNTEENVKFMDRTKLLTVRQVLFFVGEYCCNTALDPILTSTYYSFNLDKSKGKK